MEFIGSDMKVAVMSFKLAVIILAIRVGAMVDMVIIWDMVAIATLEL
jgi:hypothetical protein